MILTKAQRMAVNCEQNALVVACPGSGKTRTLVAKLLWCLSRVRETPRKIACITYTNPAVYEIDSRLRQFGTTGDEEYCDISTIHAFCLNNILRHFYWKLPTVAGPIRVLPPDSEEYRTISSSVCSDHGLEARAREGFELLNRKPDGTPIVSPPLTHAAASDFWDRLWAAGLVDFPNIVYYSYLILREWPQIPRALACKYSWFLIDEFQDTSALQVEILRLVANAGRTRFFLVGDPFQSIFGFAGARPQLMDDFASEIRAERDFELLANFRSSSPLVNIAERLIPRSPPMKAQGEAAGFQEKPLYVHADTAFDALSEHFLPTIQELGIGYGGAAVLAPWWIKLLHIGRQLRELGIPIYGPGSRPYKRTHLFARLAEQVCSYIDFPNPDQLPRISRELFNLISDATGAPDHRIFSFPGRVSVIRLVNIGRTLAEECESGIEWLREASGQFASQLVDDELLPRSFSNLVVESVNDMESDMLRNGINLDLLSISDLGIFANYNDSLKLLTMHRAKGREFDAVAIIDLHDGRVPHFSAKTEDDFEEARRLLYVAMTRARRVLMFVTDEEDWRNQPSPFLLQAELGFVPD